MNPPKHLACAHTRSRPAPGERSDVGQEAWPGSGALTGRCGRQGGDRPRVPFFTSRERKGEWPALVTATGRTGRGLRRTARGMPGQPGLIIWYPQIGLKLVPVGRQPRECQVRLTVYGSFNCPYSFLARSRTGQLVRGPAVTRQASWRGSPGRNPAGQAGPPRNGPPATKINLG
jgi:hypothetical protein